MSQKTQIASVGPEAWTSEAIQVERKGKKGKGNSYPIFFELSHYLDDQAAVEKLIAASKGKLPPKFSFEDNTLYYKRNTKAESALVLPSNPLLAAEEVIEFFTSRSQPARAVETENKSGQDEMIVWGKNKRVQEMLLSYYVTEQKQLLKLTRDEVEQLRQTLHLGMISKSFGKHNISIKDKRIQSVEGLSWNPDKRIFFIDEKVVKPIIARNSLKQKEGNIAYETPSKDAIPHFSLKLNKYLDRLEKKIKDAEKYANSPLRDFTIDLFGGFAMPVDQDSVDLEEEIEIDDELDE